MTEVELVAAALAAGASAGPADTARGAVHDLCTALREVVRRRLAGGSGYCVRVLDAHEADPEVWQSRLVEVLKGSGVEDDEEILAAARVLLGAERRVGWIAVDALDADGVHFADGGA